MAVVYQCPGEKHPISRAVHLGRLARFFPACRTCVHRDDTGSLSPLQVEQLVETRRRAPAGDPFDDEGLSGVEPNDIDPPRAMRVALALALSLQEVGEPTGAGGCRVVAAWDGRPKSVELFEAAIEGLRLGGCHVVDIGSATSACTTCAISALGAAGGVLVGNAPAQPHTVSLRFWDAASRPISDDAGLAALRDHYEAGPRRPACRYGSLSRHQADAHYLDGLRDYFHALRPLSLSVNSASGPLLRFLETLTGHVACRIITPGHPADSSHAGAPAQSDFGIWIDGDGEVCHLADERGSTIASEELLVLLARQLARSSERRAVVLEESAAGTTENALRAAGLTTVRSRPTRAAMSDAMRAHDALVGGGASGRFWFADAAPAADALRVLALLLVALSQSDRPLSEVIATAILGA